MAISRKNGVLKAAAILAILLLVTELPGKYITVYVDARGAHDITSSTSAEAEEFLEAHKQARSRVNVGPLEWSDDLARYALKYAEKQRDHDQCAMVHSRGPYGENLFWGYGKKFRPTEAVTSWEKEKEHYDYETNSCAPGKVCGHYTQVVWANSKELGCASVACHDGATFIICSYNPPGNFLGEWPYKQTGFDTDQRREHHHHHHHLHHQHDHDKTDDKTTHPSRSSLSEAEEFLEAHTEARSKVNVGALVWSEDLAHYALKYAEKQRDRHDCAMVHSRGPYGENLFWGYGKKFTPTDAVMSWEKEKEHYNYETNSCAPGKVCGHYTQVVWANSKELGCASVACRDGATFIICSYNPPGNFVGEWPYKRTELEAEL